MIPSKPVLDGDDVSWTIYPLVGCELLIHMMVTSVRIRDTFRVRASQIIFKYKKTGIYEDVVHLPHLSFLSSLSASLVPHSLVHGLLLQPYTGNQLNSTGSFGYIQIRLSSRVEKSAISSHVFVSVN